MRILPHFVAGMVLLLLGTSLWAGEPVKLEHATARTSYSLGYEMGQDFKRRDVTLNRPALIRGLQDGQTGAEPSLSREEMSGLFAELKQRKARHLAAERQAESAALKQAGIDFLEANKRKSGVKNTASGLQYKVIKEGSGKQPGPTDTVRVHYRGMTVEGQEFDSTAKRGAPREFTVNRVIKGWGEGLQLMKEGAKYELYIPWELAYGRRGPLAYQAVILEVELLEINPEDTKPVGASDNQN